MFMLWPVHTYKWNVCGWAQLPRTFRLQALRGLDGEGRANHEPCHWVAKRRHLQGAFSGISYICTRYWFCVMTKISHPQLPTMESCTWVCGREWTRGLLFQGLCDHVFSQHLSPEVFVSLLFSIGPAYSDDDLQMSRAQEIRPGEKPFPYHLLKWLLGNFWYSSTVKVRGPGSQFSHARCFFPSSWSWAVIRCNKNLTEGQ